MAFRKGAQAAEKAEKDNKKSFGSVQKIEYLKIEPEDHEYVRWLTDYRDWIVVQEHSFLPSRSPKGAGLPEKVVENWPAKPTATCRYDEAFKNEDDTRQFEDCFICDHMVNAKGRAEKPKTTIYALCCLRDPVLGDQDMVDRGEIKAKQIGKVVYFEDRTRTVPVLDSDNKPTSEEREILDVRVASFKWNNFYAALQVAGESLNDTVLDRDFRITRKGEALETRYNPVAQEKMYFNGFDGEEETRVWDAQDEDVLAYYMTDVKFSIEDMLAERASDFHYHRFFDTRHPIPLRDWEKEAQSKGGSDSGQKSQPRAHQGPPRAAVRPTSAPDTSDEEASAPAEENNERYASMGARLRGAGRAKDESSDDE